MADLTRRGFFAALAAAPVAVKAITAAPSLLIDNQTGVAIRPVESWTAGSYFSPGDVFTIEGHYVVNPRTSGELQQFVLVDLA